VGPLPEVRDGKRFEIVRSKLGRVRARDLMSDRMAKVDEDMPLSSILSTMQQMNCDEAVVLNGQEVLGVVSTSRLLKRGDLGMNTKAKRVMESPPGVGPDADAMELAETFISTRYREIVITDGRHRYLGAVTRRDLTKIASDLREFRDVLVGEIMTPNPRSVRLDESVEAAEQLMRDLDVRVLPVVDDQGDLVGVVGLRDISAYVWRGKQKETVGEVTGRSERADLSVESVMSSNPVIISPTASIAEASDLMLEKEISTLLVLEDGAPAGVFTEYDILAHMASFLERDMVLVKISGFEGNQDAYDAIFEQVHAAMMKVAKIEKPNIMDIHIHTQREKGDREAFHFQGRMTTDHRMYYAQGTAWDALQGLDAMLSHLERQVKERKDEYLEWRRRAGS
jgi:CBS domain-containing protein